MIETVITLAIYVHALFGGIGLIAGTLSVITKKGSSLHRKSGKWFLIGMLLSSGISLPIACMPGHINPFLFLIGLFTIYMVVVGKRALRYKFRKNKVARLDWTITIAMFCISIVMILCGSLLFEKVSVLYIYFGIVGVVLCISDYRFLRNPHKTRNTWLVQHIGKIMGAYIASVTAFLVAGLSISGVAIWIIPSFFGTALIIYYIKKVRRTSPRPEVN